MKKANQAKKNAFPGVTMGNRKQAAYDPKKWINDWEKDHPPAKLKD